MEADATYLRSYFGNPAAYNLRRLPRTGGGGRGEEEEEEERGGTTRFYAVDATTFRQLYNACCIRIPSERNYTFRFLFELVNTG